VRVVGNPRGREQAHALLEVRQKDAEVVAVARPRPRGIPKDPRRPQRPSGNPGAHGDPR
jgi:hypothetical protein